MEITHWHRTAYLFLKEELNLADVVKFMIIGTATGAIEGQYKIQPRIGYNVLDHSQLNDALVFGLVLSHPSDKPLTYGFMAKLLFKHPQTIGGAVNRLVERGIIVKDDHGSIGAYYSIVPDMAEKYDIPVWIKRFTSAMMDLATSEEFRAQVDEEMKEVEFKRGLQVLRAELREKFSPKSRKQE